MFLIAGLGNPSAKYKNTRHNIGFMVIDKIIESLALININKSNFKSKLFKFSNILFSKPQTFMNESGQAISSIIDYYNIKNESIIIVHDDIDLPFGTVKFKIGGGNGGHNGLKSIDNYIGQNYIRIRVGIGKPKDKTKIANFVLSNFSKKETKLLDSIISHIICSIEALKNMKLEDVKSKYTLKG
jgi:PTH1 family peptidyl-tRNA hydrolase